jgi:hypothetical protein
MASTTIKIDTEIKEQLEKDAKESFRSVKGQANYYIMIGMMVQKDLKARGIMIPNPPPTMEEINGNN